MTSEIEATSESIFEWLDQHFVSPAAMREAQIIGVQVCPCFERVLMTMSPGRAGNSAQRPESSSGEV